VFNHQRTTSRTSDKGFSLVELLVVVAVIGVLIGVLIPTLGAARDEAEKIVELSAVRNLMIGHQMYADDHAGRLISGYDLQAPAFGPDGQSLSFPENARYPWRLVPYLDDAVDQTILVHQRLSEVSEGGELDTYAVSVMPSFGINGEFVGGTWGGPYNNWLVDRGVTVRKTFEAHRPSELIVFASARGGLSGKDPVLGYHLVQPAYGHEYDPADMPFKFGFVHPRYGERAIVSFLDGHAGALDTVALRDMTHWSDAAARANDPDWRLEDAFSE